MIIKIKSLHAKTGLFNLVLTAENPGDEIVLRNLHEQHIDSGYSPGGEGTGSQLYLNGKAVHE
jgi:hypothetical protein